MGCDAAELTRFKTTVTFASRGTTALNPQAQNGVDILVVSDLGCVPVAANFTNYAFCY